MSGIGFFRLLAVIEGITTLVLFLIAMPMKYLLGNPVLVPPAGMIHGVAFMLYVAAMPMALWGRGVGIGGWARTFFASCVPFGTFINDPWLKRIDTPQESPADA